MSHFSEQNFYEILEVAPEATTEEIQKAFFRAKSTYSPNSPALYSVFTEDEAKELLRLIDEAYSVLSNHAKRREYDKKIALSSVPGGGASPAQILNMNRPDSSAGDLPDFMLPSNEANLATNSVTTHEAPKSAGVARSTPSEKGYGKTIISHYDVDPDFEKEIALQEIFDGTFLQRVRLYKSISLDQLSETSRINKAYLLAVETNDFHSLPAPVYVRGFISSIARLLGLNDKKVTDSYMKLIKESRG